MDGEINTVKLIIEIHTAVALKTKLNLLQKF